MCEGGSFSLWELEVAKCLIFLKTLSFQVPTSYSDAGPPPFPSFNQVFMKSLWWEKGRQTWDMEAKNEEAG